LSKKIYAAYFIPIQTDTRSQIIPKTSSQGFSASGFGKHETTFFVLENTELKIIKLNGELLKSKKVFLLLTEGHKRIYVVGISHHIDVALNFSSRVPYGGVP